jgi:hypothetical protein
MASAEPVARTAVTNVCVFDGWRLLLIDGHPLRDIKATQSIRRIWCGGAEVQPSHQFVLGRPR